MLHINSQLVNYYASIHNNSTDVQQHYEHFILCNYINNHQTYIYSQLAHDYIYTVLIRYSMINSLRMTDAGAFAGISVLSGSTPNGCWTSRRHVGIIFDHRRSGKQLAGSGYHRITGFDDRGRALYTIRVLDRPRRGYLMKEEKQHYKNSKGECFHGLHCFD